MTASQVGRLPDHAGGEVLQAVFSLSSNPIALVDRDRRFVAVNDAMCALIGLGRERTIGRRIDEFVAESGAEASLEPEWRAFWEDGSDWVGERRFLRKHDGAVSVHLAARRCELEGRTLAVVVITPPEREASGETETPSGLTRREREVLQLVALGYNAPQIARKLVISNQTVRTHIRNAMRRTGTRTRAQLVAMLLSEEVAAAGAAPLRDSA